MKELKESKIDTLVQTKDGCILNLNGYRGLIRETQSGYYLCTEGIYVFRKLRPWSKIK